MGKQKVPLFRQATLADLAEAVAFHVRIWRETYRDIAPREAIERLDESRRLPAWREILSNPQPGQGAWLALIDDRIIGLVCFGPTYYEALGDVGEIKHLYVDRSAKRMGLGRHLIQVGLKELALAGFQQAALVVVRENEAAQAFYRAMGGEQVGAFFDPGPLWKSDNLIFLWRELGVLS